jgi:tetratricopeptide (TPR) repeat protein
MFDMRFCGRRSLPYVIVVLTGICSMRAAAQTPEAGDSAAALIEAKRLYDATEYEGAVGVLDTVIAASDSRAPRTPARLEQLAAAYELRARARYGLSNPDGARADFRALLSLDPGRTLSAEVSPRVVSIFDETRKALVGMVSLTVEPSDAAVSIDGATARATGTLPLLAGEHTVTAQRAGYASVTRTVSVPAAGSADIALKLERVSSVVSVVSVPADVEIVLDGNSIGRTEAAATESESKPFVLPVLQPGLHTIALKRACYVTSEQRLQLQAADYRLPQVKLVRAVGQVSVAGGSGGAIYLDGQPRGSVPTTLDDVCEGAHVLEVRSVAGRHVRRFDIKVNEQLLVEAEVRPAVALLSVVGLPEGLRGGPDLRLKVEEAFKGLKTATVFAPQADQVDAVLQRERLRAGWLSFDSARRPLGEAAANITAGAREELSRKITRALDVQAIATVTVPSRDDTSDVLVTILSAKSGLPDVIRVKLDEPESLSRAIAQLEFVPPLSRLSADLRVVDVLDVAGAAVVDVTAGGAGAKAGVVAGDVIVSANGHVVGDGSAFLKMIEVGRVDDLVSLELRDRTGAAKRAEFHLINVPDAVALVDRTLLSNKLLLDFGRMVLNAKPEEEAVARLNYAVALMRVGNWAEARLELEKVHLPDGGGVSNGTVAYLLGLCHAALGQNADAEVAFRRAMESQDSLLTAEGPPVKALAEGELTEVRRRSRGTLDR